MASKLFEVPNCFCCLCEVSSDYQFELSDLDLIGETCILTNAGTTPACLRGWLFVSVVGRFGRFPQEYYMPPWIIDPGATVLLTSGSGAAPTQKPHTYQLTRAFIHNNDGDTAELYAPNGDLISSVS
jgi:hypothetical protein